MRGLLHAALCSQEVHGVSCLPLLQVRGGLTEKVQKDSVVQLSFTDVGKLPPPVLQFADVTFGYSPDRVLYRNVGAPPLGGRVWPNVMLSLLIAKTHAYSCCVLPAQPWRHA